MLFNIVIRCALGMLLSLPAFALQPDHDLALAMFTNGASGYEALYVTDRPSGFVFVVTEKSISLLFSMVFAIVVVLAIRAQHRQDYAKFRKNYA